MTKKRPLPQKRAERRAQEGRVKRTRTRGDFLDLVSRYALYAIAGLIPLTIISTTEFILYETPKVALLNIMTLVALLAWAYRMARLGTFEFRKPPFLLPVLVYFSVYLLATILSWSPVLSIFGIVDRSMGLINLTNLVLLYLLVFNVLTTRDAQVRCLSLFVLGSTVMALLGVLQYFGIDPLNLLPYAKGQRVGSTLGNPDYCTPVIVLALPLSLAFLLRKRYWCAVPAVLLFLMLIFSLPIPKLTGEWLLQIPQEGQTEAEPAAKGAVGELATVAVQRVQIRQGLWEAGWQAALKYPLLGTGPNTYRDVFTIYEPLYYVRMLPTFREDKAHNEYIEVAQSTGFLGLAAYLWMLGAALFFFVFWVWKNRKERNAPFVGAIAVGAAGYMGYTFLLFHTIAAYAVFWMLLGLGAGLCREDSPLVRKNIAGLKSLAPYAGFLVLVVLAWVGYTALRPVFADLALARARGIGVSDERSGTLAAEWYKKAADWHPFDYMYLRNAAHALSSLGASLKKAPTDPRFQEGVYYIDRAQRHEPRNATIYYNRALVYQRSGRSIDEVLRDLNKAIELYPYYILAHTMIADIERARNDLEKAIASRQKALDITPDDASIMVEMGYDSLQASKLPQAIEMLEKGIKAGNETARARFLLGGAYELSGNKEKAKEAYEASLKVDPNHARAREGLQRVTTPG